MDLVARVAGIRIEGPLEVAQAAFAAVVAPVRRAAPETLARVIGREERHAAGVAVNERRPHRKTEVLLRCHVGNRVVHEHGVELPAEPDRPHVALRVPAFGIEHAAHLEHAGREVHEGHREVLLEVGRVAAPAGTKLENCSERHAGVSQHRSPEEPGLFRVVLGRRQDRPPLGQVAVQPREFVHA